MTDKAVSVNSTRRLLLALPVAAGCLYVLSRPDVPAPPPFNIKEVALDEAKALVAAGALVLDVRNLAAYEARHITGALHMPLSTLSKSIPASLEGARSQPIVVYCGDGLAMGPEGTQLLNKAGFTQAVNLKPGIQGWDAAGLPVVRGTHKPV